MSAMDGTFSLSTLLSHAFVAFTIEFDNEFERQMPHRTTNHGSTGGSPNPPWLVSMVMWSNFLQFVPAGGVTVRELRHRLNISDQEMYAFVTRLGKWWGYIFVDTDSAPNKSKRIHRDAVIRPTSAGLRAQTTWRPLASIIEKRWQERFDKNAIANLRGSLAELVSQLDPRLPDCLPILGYGLFSKGPSPAPGASNPAEPHDVSTPSLAALLAKALLAFALEFEHGSQISLAISTNLLRLVAEKGLPVRDLPRLAGVSKEAITMAISFLEKRSYAIVQPASPGSRVKTLVLTVSGWRAQNEYRQRVRAIEEQWSVRFGQPTIARLRESLTRLVGEPGDRRLSPLFRGLDPFPEGWRASLSKPEILPHFPMLLHRGGFPDGS